MEEWKQTFLHGMFATMLEYYPYTQIALCKHVQASEFCVFMEILILKTIQVFPA